VGGFSPTYSLQCKKLFYTLRACLKLAQIACVSLITSYLRCVADACQHPARPTGQLYSEMYTGKLPNPAGIPGLEIPQSRIPGLEKTVRDCNP